MTAHIHRSQTLPLAPPGLAETLLELLPALYAVMDGALYDDLPTLLRDADLNHRSLFLDHADKEVEKAGPWFIPLRSEPEVKRVLTLIGWKPAAVFWACETGDADIYRHLRSINHVIYPYKAAAEQHVIRDTRVLFRHWDPVVFTQVLQNLNMGQFNRVLGPATSIVTYALDVGGLHKIKPVEKETIPTKGMLKISIEQANGIALARQKTSHNRIARYLTSVSPNTIAKMERQRLIAEIEKSELSGRELGLTTERALARWAYLYIRSNGEVAADKRIRTWFDDKKASPNRKTAFLMRCARLDERSEKHNRVRERNRKSRIFQ